MRVVVVRMHLERLAVRRLGLVEPAEAQVDRGEIHLRFEEVWVEPCRRLELLDGRIDLTELVEDEARSVVDRRVVRALSHRLRADERGELELLHVAALGDGRVGGDGAADLLAGPPRLLLRAAEVVEGQRLNAGM